MSNLIDNQAVEVVKEKKGFRLNTQQIFLTFPKCNLSPTRILENIQKLGLGLDKYIIAQEKHKDDDLHIHAYILLNKKINIRNEKFFDVEGFHPNIQGCRSYKNVIKYVTKDNDYITNYDKEILEKIIIENKTTKEIYADARKRARYGDVEEALSILENPKTARDLTIHGSNIRRNLESLTPKRRMTTFPLEDFNITFNWNRSRTLILWGPTDTGKTSLARALLPNALFVSHMDRLRDYDIRKYTGIIFDDMSFKHIPREGQIHIVDTYQDRDIHCRYSPAFLPAGTPRIITSNNSPSAIVLADDAAIERRIQCVWIEGPVYKNRIEDIEEEELEGEGELEDLFAWVAQRNEGKVGAGHANA